MDGLTTDKRRLLAAIVSLTLYELQVDRRTVERLGVRVGDAVRIAWGPDPDGRIADRARDVVAKLEERGLVFRGEEGWCRPTAAGVFEIIAVDIPEED